MNVHSVWSGWICVVECGRSDVRERERWEG